jgi:hypothetical protein
MKSNKQRRFEIKARRRKRAEALKVDPFKASHFTPLYSVAADHAELAHNNTYGPLPFFYVDKAFNCRDCSAHEVWTAKNQKWWFEIAKGNIDSTAIHCLSCRIKRRKEKQRQKAHMEEMAKREPHPNEAFFKRH